MNETKDVTLTATLSTLLKMLAFFTVTSYLGNCLFHWLHG